VYVHDGHSITPILEGRAAETLFGDIDDVSKKVTFLAHNESEREVWVCYPSTGQTVPNRAMVWDYDTNTWTRRDIPPIRHASQQSLVYSRASWPSASASNPSWDDSVASWDDGNLSTNFLGAGAAIYRFEDGRNFAASAPACTLERTGLKIGEGGQMVMARCLYPRASGSPFKVQVGAQLRLDGDVTWQAEQTFTPGTDAKVDCRITGEALAVRFKSNDGNQWKLDGYELDVEPVGGR
jgi:hypothetical protein